MTTRAELEEENKLLRAIAEAAKNFMDQTTTKNRHELRKALAELTQKRNTKEK